MCGMRGGYCGMFQCFISFFVLSAHYEGIVLVFPVAAFEFL